MTTYEQEIDFSNKLKHHYECDVLTNTTRPYTLYCANDIAFILSIFNIRSALRNYDKCYITKKTKGGEQSLTYINYETLVKFIVKSRKTSAIEFAEKLNLDITMKYYVSVETDIINCILKTFNGNVMTTQYKVDNYKIDLYFEEHNLAIECDEDHHDTPQNELKDLQRQGYIFKKLSCRFIRFNPNDKNFNLFGLLNSIYIHLALSHRHELK